jgi:hypothetical protein
VTGNLDQGSAPKTTMGTSFKIFEEGDEAAELVSITAGGHLGVSSRRSSKATTQTGTRRPRASAVRSPRTGRSPAPASSAPPPIAESEENVVDPYSAVPKLLVDLMDGLRASRSFVDRSDEIAPGKRVLTVPKGRRVSSVVEPTLELPECVLDVEQRVGEGAFAHVYKVELISSSLFQLQGEDRTFALKVVVMPTVLIANVCA